MKLTAENRKALEEALQPIPQQRNVSDEIIITDAAALLLEIWEPLQEMVEARGKATEGEWVTHDACYPQGIKGDIFLKSSGRAEKKNILCRVYDPLIPFNAICSLTAIALWNEAAPKIEANTHFIATSANALAAIRKAVG